MNKFPLKTYESAIDTWVAALLMLSPLVSMFVGGYLLWLGKTDEASLLFGIGAITTIITVACCLPCRYTMLEEELSVRCGLFLFYQLSYEKIREVELSSSWLSGPALSLKRVAIRTPTRTILVSPKDRQQFMDDLKARLPKIE